MRSISLKHPEILMIGNGIERAYGGLSWTKFLNHISVRDDFDSEKLECPMSMQSILLTNDNLGILMKNHSEEVRGELKYVEQTGIYRRILCMGFDGILTTNYSYELEMAARIDGKISDYKLSKISRNAVEGKIEPKYLLHSYNEVNYNNVVNNIWHIHGEARKPNSMIIGQYYYASLISKIKGYVDGHRNTYYLNEKEGRINPINSWIDAFILGEVYVVGFGFDFSEFDLWYLLERKKNEKAEHGKIVFYEPLCDGEAAREKIALLEIMGAETVSLGFRKENCDYKSFYSAVLDDIQNRRIK